MANLLDHVPSIYFPMYVGIENKRLWVMQKLADVFVILLVIAIFLNNLIPQTGEPEIRLNTWIDGLQTVAEGDHSGLCDNGLASLYDYSPGSSEWKMEGTKCANWCSGQSGGVLGDHVCVREADVTSNEASQEMFVASSFTEELHLLQDDCPFALDEDGECRRKRSFVMPGVEQAKATLDIAYQIEIPDSVYHKYISRQKHITTLDLYTVVKKPDGTVFKEFQAGEVVSLTVAEALEAADFDVQGLDAHAPDSRASEFPTNVAADGPSRPAVRVTGMDVVMIIEIGNKIIPGKDDPVCLITVSGVQTWNSRQVMSALDLHGSVRSRVYNGIRFKFHTRGYFAWQQMYKLIYAGCLAVAWMRIPFVLVFYFAVFMLGGLSDVYNGFLYQTLDFRQEFTGVCSRMLKTSFCFTDLHDLEEDEEFSETGQVWGISRERIARRMEMIFDGTALGNDKAKLELFVNLFFANSASKMPSDREAIRLDDFMEVYGSKEDLRWDDIVKIFDSNATQNTLEKLFMDFTLKAFYHKEMRIGHMQKTQYKVDRHTLKADLEASKQEYAMKVLNEKRDLSLLSQQSNLTRTMCSQEFLEERMEKLELALHHIRRRRMASNNPIGDQGRRATGAAPRITSI